MSYYKLLLFSLKNGGILVKNQEKLTTMFPVIFCVMVLIISGYMKISSIYIFDSHNEQKLIGVSYMTMNNVFYQVIDDELEKQVQEKGDKLLTLDPALDEKKQVEQICYMVDQNVDIIILNPVDWRKIRPGLEIAKKAEIPVIIIDSEVYDNNLVSATVVSDNYKAGQLCARQMMREVDKGNILILDHMEAKSALDRIHGFEDALEENKNYQIVEKVETQGQTERSYGKVREALEKYNDINVIMALNDPAALGALAAIEQEQYPSDICIFSVDASPDGKRLVNEKLICGTVAQYPRKMAQKATEIAYDLIDGKEVEKKNILPVEMVNDISLKRFPIERWQ